MHVPRFMLLGLGALFVPLAGCGHSTSPTSPGLALSRSAAHAASGLSAGDEVDPGKAPTTGRSGPKDAPPEVRIVEPRPGGYDIVAVFDASQPVIVHWTATDPDGPGPGVKAYRYLVLDLTDPSNAVFFADPDSLLRRDAPGFAGWTEVDGKSDQATLAGLQNDRLYVLYVTAFDRRRNYDPSLDLTRNGLQFMLVQTPSPAAMRNAQPPAPSERSH